MTGGRRRVLVTGATRGIGRATALLLAARGVEVVALGRDAGELASLARETGCRTLAVDLADVAATRAAAHSALPFDGLVNNAGIVTLAPMVDTAVEDFDRTLAVNTRAPLVLAQELARDLLARGAPGSIVNVSSVAARVGTVDHVAYCASKAALDAMTRVMACELGPAGIRVNGVNPVITLTAMGAQAWSDPRKSGPVMQRIPLRRFARPEEVATVIAFLLGDDAAMVNGASLEVDGGFLAA